VSGRSGNAHTALFARVALAARVALLAGGVALLGVAGAGCRGGGSGSDSGPGSGALVLDYEGAHVPTGSDGLALDVLGPDQVQLEISRRGTWVDFPLDLDARDFNGVEIELAFREGGTHHAPRLAWRREGGTFDTAASVSLPPRADPDAPFKVHLEAEPDWKGRITGLRLFAADLPDSRVVLGSIRFARWPLEALLGEGDDGAIRWFTIDSETREVEYVPAGSSRRVEVVVPEGGRIAYASVPT